MPALFLSTHTADHRHHAERRPARLPVPPGQSRHGRLPPPRRAAHRRGGERRRHGRTHRRVPGAACGDQRGRRGRRRRSRAYRPGGRALARGRMGSASVVPVRPLRGPDAAPRAGVGRPRPLCGARYPAPHGRLAVRAAPERIACARRRDPGHWRRVRRGPVADPAAEGAGRVRRAVPQSHDDGGGRADPVHGRRLRPRVDQVSA